MNYLAIALGAMVGALLRFAISLHLNNVSAFPWGTWAINLGGCFCMGVLSALFSLVPVPEAIRLGLLVGVLGGFTTFSAFGYENMHLIEEKRLALAAAYFLSSTVLGVVLVFAGAALGRWAGAQLPR